VTLKSEIQIVK